jgi:hypothetical protein
VRVLEPLRSARPSHAAAVRGREPVSTSTSSSQSLGCQR